MQHAKHPSELCGGLENRRRTLPYALPLHCRSIPAVGVHSGPAEHELPMKQRPPLRGADLANRRLQPLGHLSRDSTTSPLA